MKVTLLGGCVDESGYKDGQSNNSRFYYPKGITVDNKGNLFIADYYNHIIRKINTSGEVSTFAGKPGVLDIKMVKMLYLAILEVVFWIKMELFLFWIVEIGVLEELIVELYLLLSYSNGNIKKMRRIKSK